MAEDPEAVVILDSDSEEDAGEERRGTGAGASTSRPASRGTGRGQSGSGDRGLRKLGAGAPGRGTGRQGSSSAGVVDLTAESQGGEEDVVVVASTKKRRRSAGEVEIVSPPGAKQTLQRAKGPDTGLAYSLKCAVCLDEMTEMSSTPCGHVFCRQCVVDSIKANGQCPTCRKKLQVKSVHRIYI